MQINITPEIIKGLKQYGFNSENMGSALIALYAIHKNDIDLLDCLDDHSKERRALILYQSLVRAALIEEQKNSNVYYQLTNLGKDFVGRVIDIPKPKSNNPLLDEVSDWIDDWVNLFPEGIKSGGKILRSDRKSCLIKMVNFIKIYKFDKELIISATKSYLSEREKDNYLFTRAAIYFINKKGEGSDLAAWCEDEKTVQPINSFSNNMI